MLNSLRKVNTADEHKAPLRNTITKLESLNKQNIQNKSRKFVEAEKKYLKNAMELKNTLVKKTKLSLQIKEYFKSLLIKIDDLLELLFNLPVCVENTEDALQRLKEYTDDFITRYDESIIHIRKNYQIRMFIMQQTSVLNLFLKTKQNKINESNREKIKDLKYIPLLFNLNSETINTLNSQFKDLNCTLTLKKKDEKERDTLPFWIDKNESYLYSDASDIASLLTQYRMLDELFLTGSLQKVISQHQEFKKKLDNSTEFLQLKEETLDKQQGLIIDKLGEIKSKMENLQDEANRAVSTNLSKGQSGGAAIQANVSNITSRQSKEYLNEASELKDNIFTQLSHSSDYYKSFISIAERIDDMYNLVDKIKICKDKSSRDIYAVKKFIGDFKTVIKKKTVYLLHQFRIGDFIIKQHSVLSKYVRGISHIPDEHYILESEGNNRTNLRHSNVLSKVSQASKFDNNIRYIPNIFLVEHKQTDSNTSRFKIKNYLEQAQKIAKIDLSSDNRYFISYANDMSQLMQHYHLADKYFIQDNVTNNEIAQLKNDNLKLKLFKLDKYVSNTKNNKREINSKIEEITHKISGILRAQNRTK